MRGLRREADLVIARLIVERARDCEPCDVLERKAAVSRWIEHDVLHDAERVLIHRDVLVQGLEEVVFRLRELDRPHDDACLRVEREAHWLVPVGAVFDCWRAANPAAGASASREARAIPEALNARDMENRSPCAPGQ
jgi:hypothetical protein